MRQFRNLPLIAALGLLGGCVGFGVGYDIENMRGAEGTGDAFTRKLTEEYRRITLFEADEMYDWRDAGHFAREGLRAAGGRAVLPEPIAARELPAAHVGELSSARSDLLGLLDANARTRLPDLAGHAQGRFDCWVEQQEENFQEDHIAACRDAFYTALERLEAAMAPTPQPKKAEPAPPPAMPAPEPFLVYFAFDSAALTPDSLATLDEAVAAAKKRGLEEFAVTGHADRAGPKEYNMGLSLRRANAVREALVARGVNAADISIAARGESEPAVATADGVAEQRNRRAVVLLPK